MREFHAVLGKELPKSTRIHPPFYTDYGLNIELGESVWVNQGCSLLGQGILIGDRSMIGPGVTLATAGHPVELADRYEYITLAPIIIESDVWIGAAATVVPGVTIGRSVVGAGAVVRTDVPPLSVVTATHATVTRRLNGELDQIG